MKLLSVRFQYSASMVGVYCGIKIVDGYGTVVSTGVMAPAQNADGILMIAKLTLSAQYLFEEFSGYFQTPKC
jgi:hypothetical protein